MTSTTFGHTVRTLEGEARCVVIELGLIPKVLEMAIRTHRELAIVIVFLDVAGAALLAAAFKNAARAVTGLAIRQEMHADQFHILVEIAGTLPAILRVTFRTLSAVAAVMRILVAIRAILGFEFRKFIFAFRLFLPLGETFFSRRMTLDAFYLFMLTLDFKVRRVVIKGFPWTEGLRVVTTDTRFVGKLRLEHIFMFVQMAVLAVAFVLAWEYKLFPDLRWLGRKDDVFRWFVAFDTLIRELFMASG